MRNTLLLRLGEQPDDACEWVLLGTENQPASTVQSGTLAEAAGMASGLRVSVLASASDCLLTTASISGRRSAAGRFFFQQSRHSAPLG